MTVRYASTELFQPAGPEELEKIGSASAVIAGCGALGSAVAAILARSGLGRLRLIDRDIVRLNNIREQSLFTATDADTAVPRASAIARTAREINPGIKVEDFQKDITFNNIRDLCNGFDVLVDGLDNFETKFLVNEFSVETGIPWIYASIPGSRGISRGMVPGETPCLRCLFPEDPAPGSNGTPLSGVTKNEVISAIASFQAGQVLRKVVTGSFRRDVLSFNSFSGTWESGNSEEGPVAVCPCCRERDFPYLEGRTTGRITRLCGADSFQIYPAVRDKSLNLHELAGRLGEKNILRCNDYLLQVRIDEYDMTVFSNGRAIFKGVKDIVEARILYSRFIGN